MHEERVPRCQREQVIHVDRASRAELPHGLLRQQAQRQVPYLVAAGGLAQQAVQRVLAVQFVVAVGEDEEAGRSAIRRMR